MTPQVIGHAALTSLRLALRISGATVGIFLAVIVIAAPLGPQASHMAIHIAVMNVAAPLIVTLLPRDGQGSASFLWAATVLQIIGLWLAHTPAVMHAATTSSMALGALQAGLFICACLFWYALLQLPARSAWQAILGLIISGKLACLIAALMIFSPRALYALASHGPHMSGGDLLADQQFSGLLMITACPLSYLLVATILCLRAISGRLAERDNAKAQTIRLAE